MDRKDTLSLNEWAVLACLAERPRHGYDIAAALARETDLGTVWRVPRQLVYRALERLAALGLVEPLRMEPGEGGPPRQVYAPTRRGRERVGRWLREPVEHLRDVRGELLLKLVVAGRLRVDAAPLVEAQRARFAEPLAALAVPPPCDDPVALWRHHSAAAVGAFLDSYSSAKSSVPDTSA
jgi:PadR family transcriptional regulator AphA